MSNVREDFFFFPNNKQRPEEEQQILSKSSNITSRTTKNILNVPTFGSQDFCLKLSDDSIVDDSEDVIIDNKDKLVDKDDIIVISDSSSDCCSDSFIKQKVTIPAVLIKNHVSLTKSSKLNLEISDNSDEDERFYQAWKNRTKPIKFSDKDKTILQDNNSFYTSDESSKSNSSSFHCNQNDNISEDSHISSLSSISQHKDKICNTKIKHNMLERKQNIFIPTSNLNSLCKSNIDNNCNSNSNNTNSRRLKTLGHLTKSDINKILKNIQSRKAVYESPEKRGNNNIIIDESIDEEINPLLEHSSSIKKYEKPATTVLDGQSSEANILTISKVPNESIDTPINNHNKDLSERKRKEISHWIMTNSPDSCSDSSCTNIPASSRNSIGSGNSSLERFEMNYETPNNRGKVIKFKANEKNNTMYNVNKEINNAALKKNKENDPVYRDAKEPCNMNVMECADILDKLYGNIWRDKANALLTPTEKQNIIKKDRAVQTERKAVTSKYLVKTKEIKHNSTTNEKSQVKSISKKQNKYRTEKNSFIDDTSSNSERDSLYYTALTTPRTPSTKSCNPVSSFTQQKLIEICDSETEDDEYNTNYQPKIGRTLDRKKLSFSDEESGSSTSEFDPGDDISEKRLHKTGTGKTKKVLATLTSKYPITSVENNEKKGYKSFLASLSDLVPISIAHPDAKKYRQTYKNNKEELCKYLYSLYNEKVFDKQLPEDMLIEWNVRMRGTAGYCYNKKSVIPFGSIRKSSRIVLATKILDTPDRLRDTLIHEMCHAAAWLINDVSDGHGPIWAAWANKAKKVFPELPPIRRCHDYKIKTKFTYRCISCGYSIGRHSKSLDIEKKRCGHCYGKFELLINKTTKSGTVQVQTPKREPSAFALYVKENYNSVKKEKNLKHAEVMKLLGQQFSSIKIGKKNDNNIASNEDIDT